MALMCIATSLTMAAQPKAENDKGNDGKPQERNIRAHHRQPTQWHRAPQCDCCNPPAPGRRAAFGSQIIDMQAIRAIGLDSVTVKAVRELRKKKAEELKEMRLAMRPSRPEATADNGQKAKKDSPKADKRGKVKKGEKKANGKNTAVTTEDRKARREQAAAKIKENREKVAAFLKGYRAELRQLLGDEKYIAYLEKQTQQPRRQYRHAPQKRMRPAKRPIAG